MHSKNLPFYCLGTNGIVVTDNSVTADLQGVPKMLEQTSRINYSRQNKKKIKETIFRKGVVFESIWKIIFNNDYLNYVILYLQLI